MSRDDIIHKSCCLSKTKDDPFVVFCGDTFLQTRDRKSPFTLILSDFENALVYLNLETSLKSGIEKKKNVSLKVQEDAFELIPENVQFINIVNNHTADCGDPVFLVKALEKRGKIMIGPANPSRTCATIEGIRVDFFGAYFRLPRLCVSFNSSVANKLEKMVRASDAKRCVVNLHWGYEHIEVPAPFQRNLAYRLIDAGASIIIGHHSHVAQGYQIYCGVPIFYSLGNFNFWQFDKETTEENKWGYMVRYNLKNGNASTIPYQINENYQPFSLSSQKRDDLIARLNSLSEGVRSINSNVWFTVHYKKWYANEFRVWKERCRRTKSPMLLLKFIIWLILPMQLWFYRCHFFRENN
jgi:hypothetical protein